MFILRKRPTGTDKVPVTLVGVKSDKVASRSFGTTLAHSLDSTIRLSTSFNGMFLFSLIVNAWL